MKKEIIKKGDKYGMLTAVKFDHRDKYGRQYWLFHCDCSREKVIQVSNIKYGNVKSCGCLLKETTIKRNTTHGMTHTKAYQSWTHMKKRCYNKNNKRYKDYGARGIKVCGRWLNSFENFYEDMGKRPDEKSLDRVDNSKGYSLDNCRWATAEEQANNRRNNHLITFRGKTLTMIQWSKEKRIGHNTLYMRLKLGWSIKESLETPVR